MYFPINVTKLNHCKPLKRGGLVSMQHSKQDKVFFKLSLCFTHNEVVQS